MLSRFLEYITLHRLIEGDDTVLIAVSGGVDSVCLAHLFGESPFQFAIAHCNFQLRGEDSDQDERFVKQLAEKLGVAFHSVRFNTNAKSDESGVSTQMAARELRYEWFEKLMEEFGYQKLATAHHLNDSAETAIFNMAKGTGIAGIRGIRAVNNQIIRPLLFAEKEDVLSYAQAKNISWREDVSNSSDHYKRNYIRQNIIPGLLQINPSFMKGFAETSDRMLLAEKGLELLVNQTRKQFVKVDGQQISLSISPFGDETAYVLLHELIKPYGFSLRQAREILRSGMQSGKEFFSEDYWLVKDRERFVITKKSFVNDQVLINADDHLINVGKMKFSIELLQKDAPVSRENHVAMLDYDRLRFPLIIRNWEPGEKFTPLGMAGKKKISDFMIDHKIPLNLKKSFQVLVSEGEIAWLIGLRIDNRFKITDRTKRIFKIEFNTSDV